MSISLGQLAQLMNGTLLGNPDILIVGANHPLAVQSEQELALILDQAIVPKLKGLSIKTALVPAGVDLPDIENQLIVERPKVALAHLLAAFNTPPSVAEGIHPSAVIDATAVIEDHVSIGPLCSVGPNTRVQKGTRLVAQVTLGASVEVGQDCLLYPGVVLGDRVRIGNRVILQPHATLGADGFSFVTAEPGSVETVSLSGEIRHFNHEIIRINSVGTVVLEDDVEIGACSCIDRATLGETRIKAGTKLDNLVQIGHNVTIGQNNLIVAQVAIGGSCTIGDRTVIAGQAGIKDHVKIGSDCIIMARAGVIDTVPDKTSCIGGPAMGLKDYIQREMDIKKIKKLNQTVKSLEARLAALEKTLISAEPVTP
jgi:UDP-3-O-[3-hydroxymyristoyl] glucosamine N-acyltransferase